MSDSQATPSIEPIDGNSSPASAKDKSPAEEFTLEILTSNLVKALDSKKDSEIEKFCKYLSKYIENEVNNAFPTKDYNVVILYDNTSLVRSDSDKIYSAVSSFKEKKPILLTVYSRGGDVSSAYLVGKMLREYSDGKFITCIPRIAKSAATIICCAADEIHMGILSELGPIDPQINKMPALGLKYSVEHIAELAQKYPESSNMFASYLHMAVEPISIGYYERVAESATQYAERLLTDGNRRDSKTAKKISKDLVYKYKDHGFVIDKSEAAQIFGSDIIKINTTEYDLSNVIYLTLKHVSDISGIMGYTFYYIGNTNLGANFNQRKVNT